MSPSIENNRWSVASTDFATRVIVPDLQGFFDKLPILGNAPKGRTLIIEPGTRALIIDEGMLIGELSAGSYTLELFVQRLQFWRNKQATIFLVRGEDVPIESKASNVPSLENVCFHVGYRWTTQVIDILQFMGNLMGAKTSLSIQELEELLSPIVGQALYTTIGSTSYDQILHPDFVTQLSDGIKSRLDVKLQRYGLDFVGLQQIDLTSDSDKLTERKGELFQEAREVQLQRAAAEIENEQLTAKLDDYRQKTRLRSQLREVVSEDNLNKIHSQEDLKKAIADVDKERLMRTEDREALLAAYEARKGDRENLRNHLLATLDIQREQELEELRVEMDYAVQLKSLQRQLDLTNLSHTQESSKWRHAIEQEKEEATHRRQQKSENVKACWDRIRNVRQQKRDDSWQAIQHDQKMEEVRSDLEVATAERARKVAIIQSELNARLAGEKLEIEKRQREWELEHRQQRSSNQLERLQRLQEMNAQVAERQQRMQLELENLKEDSASKRELNRIQVMAGLSTEVLIATAGSNNAALLADLKKHEATQEAIKVQATSQPTAQLNEERLRMYEKMNESERAKADAIAEAYKAAMQAQSGIVHQMVGGLAQAYTPIVTTIPTHVATAARVTPPSMPVVETWYVSIHGQQTGPLSRQQLLQYIQSGQVVPATMVWKSGLPQWVAANQLPELSEMLGPPTIPPSLPIGSGPPSLPPQ